MSGNSMFMWETRLFQLDWEVIDKAITNEKISVIVKDSLEAVRGKTISWYY